LKKKLLIIPIDGQYEQQCNAAALEKAGITKLRFLDESTAPIFLDWVKKEHISFTLEANDIRETLDYLMSK